MRAICDLLIRRLPPRGSDARPAPRGYHGVPVLRRPHWKWHIPLYFFVSGVGSGAALIGAIAGMSAGRGNDVIARRGQAIGLLAVATALPLLIDDLGRPARFHHMLRTFKPRSPMSMGSWALLLFGNLTGLATAADGLANRVGAVRYATWLRGGAALARAVLIVPAAFVASYTGVLLAATAVPLWARARAVLPPLFLVAAVSTGAAAIDLSLGEEDRSARATVKDIETAALAGELALVALLVRRLGEYGRPLVARPWGQLFWGAVLLGQIVPLLFGLAHAGDRPGMRDRALRCATLVGGWVLRWTIVQAGKTSADDPVAALDFHGGRN